MTASENLLHRINEIAVPIMDGKDGTIRCVADEQCSGIPKNFIDAISHEHGDAVGEEFHILIRDFAQSFRKSDGDFPNVVNLHFQKRTLAAELRTEIDDTSKGCTKSFQWTTLNITENQ